MSCPCGEPASVCGDTVGPLWEWGRASIPVGTRWVPSGEGDTLEERVEPVFGGLRTSPSHSRCSLLPVLGTWVKEGG